MSCDCHDGLGGRYKGLYRDRDNGLLFGVCAGVAHYFDVSLLATRVLAVLSLLLFTLPTIFVYVVAAVLLKERRLSGCICKRERDFWRNGGRYGT